MPSFLVTPKMNPALARRVQASLAGDVRTRGRRSRTRRVRAWGRLLAVAGIATLAAFLFSTYRQSRREVEIARRQLVLQWTEEEQAGPVNEVEWLRRLEDLLLDAARGDHGDFAVTGLDDRLDELRRGGAVYLRASSRDANARPSLQAAAGESAPDAFSLCLTQPPSTREETDMLRHLGTASSDGSPEVHSIASVYARADFLSSNFIDRVKTARHMSQLDSLAAQWDAAPLLAGREAAGARLFIYVIDEPVPSGAREDFDGEGPHHVRFGLVDLDDSDDSDDLRVLWRARREVSPDWISDKSRLSFSRPLNSCRLALDLRRELANDGND